MNRVIHRQMDLQRMRKGLSNGLDWDGRSLPAERQRIPLMFETSATRESFQLTQYCTEGYQRNRLDAARNIHLLSTAGARAKCLVFSPNEWEPRNHRLQSYRLIFFAVSRQVHGLYLCSAISYQDRSDKTHSQRVTAPCFSLENNQEISAYRQNDWQSNNASVNRKENAFEVIISMQFLETSRRISPFLIHLSADALHHRHHVLLPLTYITLAN